MKILKYFNITLSPPRSVCAVRVKRVARSNRSEWVRAILNEKNENRSIFLSFLPCEFRIAAHTACIHVVDERTRECLERTASPGM